MKIERCFRRISCAALIVLSACSPASTGTGTQTNAGFPALRIGDSYPYGTYAVDSNDVPIPDKYGSFRKTIVDVGTSYFGRPNVVSTRLDSLSGVTSFDLINYEPNGDLSRHLQTNGPGYRSGWLTIPRVSHAKTSFIDFDTIVSGSHLLRTESYTYVGTETLSLAGYTFLAEKFTFERYDQDGVHDLFQTEWYDSVTGWLIKMDRPGNWLNRQWGGSHFELAKLLVR